MKLNNLNVANFRCLKDAHIDAQGHNVNISGANGVGKTTVEDAFLWLLFGRDSAGGINDDLIPHAPGSTQPAIGEGLEPNVEGKLDCDGRTVTLKKVYAEQWPKNRATKVREYAGSKPIYYVNGLEVKAKDYTAVVGSLIQEDVFKLITNPHCFLGMDWRERRATLVKIAGNLEVEPPAELSKLMGIRPFAEFQSLMQQQARTIQKGSRTSYGTDTISAAIIEARRQVPNVTGKVDDADKALAGLAKKVTALNDKLFTLQSDKASDLKKREIAQVETQIEQARAAYQRKMNEKAVAARAISDRLRDELSKAQRQLMDATGTESHTVSEIQRLNDRIRALSEEWDSANARKAEVEKSVYDGSGTCPTCGQKLPEDQIQAAKEKFNLARSDKLEEMSSVISNVEEQGKQARTELDAKGKSLSGIRESIGKLKEKVSEADGKVKAAQAKDADIQPSFEMTAECKALADKLSALKARVKGSADNSKAEQISAVQAEIDGVQAQITEQRQIKRQIEDRDKAQIRVTELMAEEKRLNGELEAAQHSIYLCGEYTKAKARALEDAVNGLFHVVKFQMFETQKNGEEAECCNIVYPNGSTKLSTGERLQAGIDVINTLQKFYGVTAPIFVDDYEGISGAINTDAQVFTLEVRKNQPELRIEVLP